MEATWLPKRYERYMAESETGSMLSQVTTALEDSVDSFTQHVAEDIIKRQSLAAKLEHLAKADMSRHIVSMKKEIRGGVGVDREERHMVKWPTSHP